MKPCPLCETDLQDGQLTCHKCGFMFASEPVKVKTPQVNATSSQKLSPSMAACICVAIFASWWLFFGIQDNHVPAEPAMEEASYTGNDSSRADTAGVFACAKQQLLSMLASPRSAKFPWVHTDAITHELSEGNYIVHSYLDAENSFGAMIRQEYTCTVRFETIDDCSADCSMY